jgi:hypothetical protein
MRSNMPKRTPFADTPDPGAVHDADELEEALASIASGALRLHRLLQASRPHMGILPFLKALSSLSPRDDGRN